MPSFRFYNPAPVFMDMLGLAPLSGGSLAFYQLGTTTPKPTYSDPGLTVPNQNPVPLDSAGRSNTNIWCNGSYSVALFGADGTQVWTRDIASGDGGGATIPALQSGQLLSNDGSNLIWVELLQLPDPTDSANSILSTDGVNAIWIPQQAIPQLDVVLGTAALQLGTSSSTTKFYIQRGTASAPASGGKNTSIGVTFPKAFKELWHVSVTQTHDGVSAYSTVPQQTNPNQSTTGFTARFSTDENSTASGWNITSPVPFSWLAFGTIEATP